MLFSDMLFNIGQINHYFYIPFHMLKTLFQNFHNFELLQYFYVESEDTIVFAYPHYSQAGDATTQTKPF